MARRLSIELELPDDVLSELGDADMSAKAKEALVMELVREHRISQGKAAEVLAVPRADLFSIMTRHQVPVIDLSTDELRSELEGPISAR